MRGIKSIDISTENCELFRFDAKYIGDFWMEDITKQVGRIGCNYIGEYMSCKRAVIEIFAEGNVRENDASGFSKSEWENGSRDIFKRLAEYNDITSVDITYCDNEDGDSDGDECDCGCDGCGCGCDESVGIYVPYEEKDDSLGSPNILQSCFMNNFGDLFIVIGRNEGGEIMRIEDCFDMEEIQNKESVEFKKSMIME